MEELIAQQEGPDVPPGEDVYARYAAISDEAARQTLANPWLRQFIGQMAERSAQQILDARRTNVENP
jgi:hypothetical protein